MLLVFVIETNQDRSIARIQPEHSVDSPPLGGKAVLDYFAVFNSLKHPSIIFFVQNVIFVEHTYTVRLKIGVIKPIGCNIVGMKKITTNRQNSLNLVLSEF